MIRSVRTRGIAEWLRSARIPYRWRDPEHPAQADDSEATSLIESLRPAQLPLVRIPGGVELRAPSNGEVSRALGIGLELADHEEVDLLIVGGGPAGLGAAVYGASEGLDTLVLELFDKETLDKEQVARIFEPLHRRPERPAWTGSDRRIPSQIPPVEIPQWIKDRTSAHAAAFAASNGDGPKAEEDGPGAILTPPGSGGDVHGDPGVQGSGAEPPR